MKATLKHIFLLYTREDLDTIQDLQEGLEILVEETYRRHQWRMTQPRSEGLRLLNYYNNHIRLAVGKLKSFYSWTLIYTRLGFMQENGQIMDNSNERQIYLLYLDGITFRDFNDYDRIIDMFENQ